MLGRKALTDLLIATLADVTELAVGDAHSPEPGTFGWSGTPGSVGSTFTPYNILTPLTASRPDGPLSDSHADWQMPYTISSFGTSRSQCEWLADIARGALIALRYEEFDGVDGDYTIQQVRVDSIGGIQRSDSVEPPTFGQSDMITVWITKGT